MTVEQEGKYCKRCQDQRLHQRKPVNHVLHLLLTFFTGGCWGLVWLFLVMTHIGGWRCTMCGSVN